LIQKSFVDHKATQFAQQLLDNGFDNFSDHERWAITRIASRLHVVRNVNHALAEQQTLSDRLAERRTIRRFLDFHCDLLHQPLSRGP